MPPMTKLPTYGLDATGTDAYAEVIADPATAVEYHWIAAGCASFPAILSLDGGTTDTIYVAAALTGPLLIHVDGGFKSVQAKNGTAQSNYTALWVQVW